MARLGMMTCANVANDMACSAIGCFAGVKARDGAFERYDKASPLDVVGFITCTGCPTAVGAKKILHKVRSLVASGVDALHVTHCMELLCPFLPKYLAVIKDAYPQLTVVLGTHGDMPGMPKEQARGMFKAKAADMLCQQRPNLVEAMVEAMSQLPRP